MSCARRVRAAGDDPSARELLWEYRFAFGHEKPDCPGPGRPARKGILLRRPSWPDGTSRPLPAAPGVAADTRLAVSTLRPPRALNQVNGRQHR